MNIFELGNEIESDTLELGLRVAVALYVENKTPPENFIFIMWFKNRLAR